MVSPRVALIHLPNNQDSFKYIFSRSQRIPFEDNLRNENILEGHDHKGESEDIDVFEFRYDHIYDEHLKVGGCYFYQNLEMVGENSGEVIIEKIGTLKTHGIELVGSYQTDIFTFIVSHTYTKLIYFSLRDNDTIQAFSSSPYGFGDDLVNWSNNETKI